MTRLDEVLGLLPATFPELHQQMGVTRSNLIRILTDAMVEDRIHRVVRRRSYVYMPGGRPRQRAVSSVFDLGANL